METGNKMKEGGVGLTYPTLSRSNYTSWALKMKVFMQAQNVWEAVEPKDQNTKVDERKDRVALAVIYQGLPEDILLSVADKKTAKEAWTALKTMCLGAERVKKAKVQTLKGEFEIMQMKDNETLDDFCMKLSGIVTNIRALGEEVQETYVVKKLLRAVPQRFLQIASTLEQFGDLEKMTIEEAVGSLKAHEERLRGKTEPSTGQLLLTEDEWLKRETEGKLLLTRDEWEKRTSQRNRSGGNTWRSRDRRSGFKDKSQVKCFNCNVYGHYASDCRKPSRREKGNKIEEVNISQAQDEEPALLMAKCEAKGDGVVLLNEANTMAKLGPVEHKKDSNVWYLDNGASNHMTGSRSKFRDLDDKVTGCVRFGDGSTVEIKGKGTVSFRCKNGEEKLLTEVYYIPNLCNNIISLGQLSEEGNRVVLHGVYLWVYDENDKLVMKVKRSGNRLYKIIIENASDTCLLANVNEEAWLWHSRLGHVNFAAMTLMSKNKMARDFPDIVQPKEICTGCLMAKQVRKSFPAKASYRAKQALELVHCDLCGPIVPETPSGNKYIFLLVDDYSRAMWVYLLKSKDETFDAFKKFRALVEDAPEKRVKTLRTDNGGEFCSNQFKSYCENAGIKRHYTAPYSPQQNGVVERRNRTMVAMARSLLKEMQLPSFFWGEAIRHAIYLLNRLPTRALSEQTPHEVWTGVKPSLGHIRVFGCTAHMKIPSNQVRKLDDRSKPVINLGKEPGTKAYRLYDPELKQIHVSRDVVFEEKKVWPWKREQKEAEVVQSGHFTVPGFDTDSLEQNEVAEELGTPIHASITASCSSSPQESGASMSASMTSSGESSQGDSEPRRFRLLGDIYNETEETEPGDELLLMGIDEPVNYMQACKKKEWKNAMERELESIENNNTWKLMELPPGSKAIDLKWVFKLKKDSDGNVVKHKARLVAKGYVQVHGIDFEEIFAPVTRLETVRLLLALSAKHGWEVHHLDVKSAFLNGELDEVVYVSQPEGFVKEGQEHKVYRLYKALYGLRQAPRAWYAKLSRCLEEMGLVRCPYEHAVYTKKEGNESLVVAVYVDDLLITSTSTSIIERFKKEMSTHFDMTDLGKLSYYLGIEVQQSEGLIKLKQTAYAKKILEKSGLNDCNPTKYPMDPKLMITKDEGGVAVNSTEFKSLVGGLRYLVHTRPDLAYAVGIVSRFMERPTQMHLNAAKRILRYVKGTLNYGLVYSHDSKNNMISGYSDSDLGGNFEDRKSTAGMAFYLNESLISWVSQKQKCVALSSCEAEFMAATAAACQGIWLRNLLGNITDNLIGPVVLYVDNRSAIDLAKNPVFHGRSKHIDIRYHFIRECVQRGEIVIKHIRTEEQKADVLTKALSIVKFERMCKLLGVKDLTQIV